MQTTKTTFILLLTALSASCAMKQPQTAAEFRQMIPSNSYGLHETITVDKRYAYVVNRVKEGTGKCLTFDLVMTTVNRRGGTMGEQTLTYTPTLRIGKNRSELAIQKTVSGDGMIMGKVPEKGMYMMVADLAPAGGRQTRIDIYRYNYDAGAIAESLKEWAAGKNLSCRNLTR